MLGLKTDDAIRQEIEKFVITEITTVLGFQITEAFNCKKTCKL